MLEFVLLAAAEEGARPFPEPVVEALRRVVPCDTVAYRAWSRKSILDRSFAPDDLANRRQVWLQYPHFRHDDPYPSELGMRNGGPPAVSAPEQMSTPLVLTDAISERRFWQTGLYHELMRPFGVRDVVKLFLPQYGGTASAFVFDTSGAGFSERDRVVLTRLVPALMQFQRNARLRSRSSGTTGALGLLTPRELTILGRTADGETNAEIAAALYIGESTVRKHLEHIYDKLGVRNRAAAVAAYTEAEHSRCGTGSESGAGSPAR
jgi:DNA-binding CsgD family transcriptional regulator